jgi:hypothetical protein
MGLTMGTAHALEIEPGQFIGPRRLIGIVAFAGNSPLPSDQSLALVEISDEIKIERGPLLSLPANCYLKKLRTIYLGDSLVLGIADMTNVVVSIDVKRDHVLVVGHPESGKTTTLKTLASELNRTGRHCIVFTDSEEVWFGDEKTEIVLGLDQQKEVLRRLRETPTETQAAILIDFENDFDDDLSRELDQQIRQKFIPVIASMSYQTANSFLSGVFNTVKKSRIKILLQPDDESTVSAMSDIRMRWRPEMQFPQGRAVLIESRKTTIVQVALPD